MEGSSTYKRKGQGRYAEDLEVVEVLDEAVDLRY